MVVMKANILENHPPKLLLATQITTLVQSNTSCQMSLCTLISAQK